MQSIITGTLQALTERSEEIIQSTKDTFKRKWSSYPPGLQRQYELQIERLERDGLAWEIAQYPGLSIATNLPSMSAGYCSVLFRLHVFADSPNPGKKCMSLSPLLMHPFSRGTVVSMISCGSISGLSKALYSISPRGIHRFHPKLIPTISKKM